MDICKYGLYRCKDPRKYYHGSIDKDGRFLYHCRNWTFTVSDVDENTGIVTLADTYYGFKNVEVDVSALKTDFELVMDTREFRRVPKNTDLQEYSPQDIRIVADDSGGLYSPGKYVRIGAKKDLEKQIRLLKERITMARSELQHLEWQQRELEREYDSQKAKG